MRCTPQTITGMIGTCASSAIRATPVLNSLSSKLRLIVASGYTPTSSPARSRSTATGYASPPELRSTGMSPARLTRKLPIGTCCTSALSMKRTRRRRWVAASPAGRKST
ncbi:Uncharacterised protein [Mycobacteroides abscessus subsp. abscessus]|nr:Uncharacterised protein [Mycobacteroides abscessus subsp. abscessus]